MSLGKGKVTRDREESCWRLRVQQRRENFICSEKGGGEQSPTEKRKGGKKQRRENFICFEKGGKTESNREEKRGKKNREKTEMREFYML